MEDPIDVLRSGGLTNRVERYGGDDAYTYVFDGQLGTLDLAFATRSMRNWVTGTTVFRINADESDVFDYDTSFKPPAQDAPLRRRRGLPRLRPRPHPVLVEWPSVDPGEDVANHNTGNPGFQTAVIAVWNPGFGAFPSFR